MKENIHFYKKNYFSVHILYFSIHRYIDTSLAKHFLRLARDRDSIINFEPETSEPKSRALPLNQLAHPPTELQVWFNSFLCY